MTRTTVLASLLFLTACADKAPSDVASSASERASSSPSGKAKAGASAKASASAAASPASASAAAPPASASAAPGAASPSSDPWAGAQADPGEEVPIPYAKGWVVVAPKGWKTEGHEKGADTRLTPPSGKGTIVFAGTASGSALELRVSDFLKETKTAGEKWEPPAKVTLGVDALAASVVRGEGFQTLPKGAKETHKLLRVTVQTDLPDLELDVRGKTLVTIQALAEWSGDDADFEKGAIEAIKGIRKKK